MNPVVGTVVGTDMAEGTTKNPIAAIATPARRAPKQTVLRDAVCPPADVDARGANPEVTAVLKPLPTLLRRMGLPLWQCPFPGRLGTKSRTRSLSKSR